MVEEFESEMERRREVVRLIDEEGLGVGEAAARVGRGRRWATKWHARAVVGEPLDDRSRRPNLSPTTTPPDVVDLVLDYRDRLEANPVASIGGLSILAAMERGGVEAIPGERTIERILARAGRTHPQTVSVSKKGPGLPLPQVGTSPGVWQQADWIQDRYLQGGARFNSLTISDVGSHGICAGQHVRRTVLNAVSTLVEQGWRTLSIPRATSVDNAFIKTTHPNNPWTNWTRTCLFFGVEVVVSPPGELGWTNHVEAANHLWQQRTIARQFCEDLEAVRRVSATACDWFNTQRPALDPAVCGTRYPAEHIANHRDQLRWPPDIFIADHLNHKGQLVIPLTEGRITFLRRVDNEFILIAQQRWATPGLSSGSLVVASITTADQTITLQHRGEPFARHPYPINHPIQQPYYQPHPDSIYQHA